MIDRQIVPQHVFWGHHMYCITNYLHRATCEPPTYPRIILIILITCDWNVLSHRCLWMLNSAKFIQKCTLCNYSLSWSALLCYSSIDREGHLNVYLLRSLQTKRKTVPFSFAAFGSYQPTNLFLFMLGCSSYSPMAARSEWTH